MYQSKPGEGFFVVGGLAAFACWLFVALPLLYHLLWREGGGVTEFLGLSANGWTAVGTMLLAVFTAALAVVTLILVVVGRGQITAARDEARRTRTLQAVDRYDFDPILDSALRNIKRARDSGTLEKDPVPHRLDITTLLNYLESIAIGIDQGIYIEELAKMHLQSVLVRHYNQYFGPSGLKVDGIDPANYRPLTALYKKWSTDGE